MKKNNIKSSADMFLYKAIIDLNTSKYLLEAFNENKIEIDLETIFFHLQQCAEKSIKSLLTYHKVSFYKTHDIQELVQTLNDNNIITLENIEKLEELTSYAVEGRYAIIHDDIYDIDIYIEILQKLTHFVEVQIGDKK